MSEYLYVTLREKPELKEYAAVWLRIILVSMKDMAGNFCVWFRETVNLK